MTDKQQAAMPRPLESCTVDLDHVPADLAEAKEMLIRAKRALTERTEQLAAEQLLTGRFRKGWDDALLRAETAEAKVARLTDLVAARDARIDALMLEYCPSEMSAEQVSEWMKHQREVPEAKHRALLTEIDKEIKP